MAQNNITYLNMTRDERDVLLGLLTEETAGAVHAIITAPQLDAKSKTFGIIKQLDWVFALRHSLNCVPDQGGVIALTEFGRYYCDKMMAEASPERFPDPADRAKFYQVHRSLKPKIVDVVGVNVDDDELKPEIGEN